MYLGTGRGMSPCGDRAQLVVLVCCELLLTSEGVLEVVFFVGPILGLLW